jgi:hypothetical protein
MGVVKRVAVSWKGLLFAVVAALAWLSASLVSCPRVLVKFVSKAGVEITTSRPAPGPRLVAIENDDLESQENDLEPCGLPGAHLGLPPSFSLSQITPQQTISFLSILTAAQNPLRC